jgi:hypothetical protein
MKRKVRGVRRGVSVERRSLISLADSAAQRWMRADRLVNPPFRTLPAELQPQMAEQYREEARVRRERAGWIRKAIRERAFISVLDGMGWFDMRQFCFLEHAFPLMTPDERATTLKYVWCRLRTMPSPTRALRLFRAASSLRDKVPTDWPATVPIYRGGSSHSAWPEPWQRAKRIVRRGVAWSTDRADAMRFATRLPGGVGCLGTATVSRTSILAYFHDPEELEIDGRMYPVEGYHEHECIIDPTTIQHITYERVPDNEDAKTRDRVKRTADAL